MGSQNSRLQHIPFAYYKKKQESASKQNLYTVDHFHSSLNSSDSLNLVAPEPLDTLYIYPFSQEQQEILEYNESGELVQIPRDQVDAVKFGHLESLAVLGFCSQGLVKTTSNIGYLRTTVTLQLCCNSLIEIPDEIGYLKNLKSLSLSKNRLDTLPDSIGLLKRLVELKVSHNKLKKLPKTIGMLGSLKILLVEHNCLTEIPGEVGKLTKLETFDCSFNPLSSIAAEILSLEFLKSIKIDGCPLTSTFPIKFMETPSLKELCARTIIRQRLKTSLLSDYYSNYLGSASECSFCKGPYFERYTSRYRWVTKLDQDLHVEYRLCCSHWRTEQERIACMFKPLPVTAPLPASRSLSSLSLNSSNSLPHLPLLRSSGSRFSLLKRSAKSTSSLF